MSRNTVNVTIELGNRPPLTAAQQAELERLAALPDAAIDTPDIPPLGEAFWADAVRFRDRALSRRCSGPPPCG